MRRIKPASLKSTQRLFLKMVRQPLTGNYRLKPMPKSGSLSRKSVHGLIKSNDILQAEERLELYARQYWFRIIDSLIEDFPGVRAILGEKRFDALIEDYIARCPSRSYTLRNLGSRFPGYLKLQLHSSRHADRAALEMAKLEWEKIEAFDAAEYSPLDPEALTLASAKLQLQPHVRLLTLDYPVDDWLVRLNREEWRAEASNAVDASGLRQRRVRNGKPVFRSKRVQVVVHRHEFRVYFKRVEPEAFALLQLLQKGIALESALQRVVKRSPRTTAWWQRQLSKWFAEWSALHWLHNHNS